MVLNVFRNGQNEHQGLAFIIYHFIHSSFLFVCCHAGSSGNQGWSCGRGMEYLVIMTFMPLAFSMLEFSFKKRFGKN